MDESGKDNWPYRLLGATEDWESIFNTVTDSITIHELVTAGIAGNRRRA